MATTTNKPKPKSSRPSGVREAAGYVRARARVALTAGQSLRVMRELQEMSQADLAEASGIQQSAISSIESGRVALGAERAEKLARALQVHPATLLWPNWDEAAPSVRASA